MTSDAISPESDTLLGASEIAFLIGPEGRIVAADGYASSYLASGGSEEQPVQEILATEGFRAAVARILLGEREFDFEPPVTSSSGGATSPVRVLLRRLDGESGPLALVTLRHGTPPLALDALTGLPDRRAIVQRIESWRRVTSTSSPRFAVLFLDLDDFKRINDEHGHAAGDRVLELFAARLVECVREEDLVVRYGGDEFVLLLKSVASVDGAAPVVDRVKACACEAILFGDLRLQIGATIGVAIAEHAEQSIEDVIAAADRDMYARKRRRLK